VEWGIVIEQWSELLQKRCEGDAIESSNGMRDWSTSEASRLRHGDAANVSNEAQEIFLKQRRHSASERLFRDSFLYPECFTTGESPVAVTLTTSNLNINEDGVIRFVVILPIEYLFIGPVFGRNFVQSLHLKWVPMFLTICFYY
jgi:hypothetical protein